MSKELDQIQQGIMDLFDNDVRDLGQEEYRELLENIFSDFESRLECIKEEMAAAEESED